MPTLENYNAGQSPIRAVLVDPTTGADYTASGGGGGGGAVTIANGADATQGAIADAAYTSGNGTVVSILKGIFGRAAQVWGLNGTGLATYANPVPVNIGVLAAGTNRSGTATTTSGGLTVAANTARRGLVGQNISGVVIGFNEFGGTAAIGTAGTYSVPAGSSFAISTTNAVNFIAASGTAAVTMTEY